MSIKKKILLTSLSGQLGGLELRLANEARFLNKIGYSSELALNPFPQIAPWVEQLTQEGLLFKYFSPPSFFEEWEWRRINKIRADLFYKNYYLLRDADLVHVAMAWTETVGTRLWLAYRCNLPAVISVHNAFPYHQFTSWHEDILSEAFQVVRGIYAVSDSALQFFLKTFNKFIPSNCLLEVIYNPIDTRIYKPSAQDRCRLKAKLGISSDAFVIGAVGRLDVQKQPELLIDVFSALKKRFSQLVLVLVGQGRLENNCKKKVENLGLSDSVYFLGQRNDICEIIPVFDLHVLLSKREGFGIATAEAMACSVPVIASDVPGSKDILQNSKAGILVPLDDFDSIVDRISELIVNHALRRSMSEAGPKEVGQRFALEVIEEQLKQFYQAVL